MGLVLAGLGGFSFVTLASTALQLHSSSTYRGRVMALWVFVYIGTTPIGSVLTGWIADVGGARVALLVGAGSCLVASGFASRITTPPTPLDDHLGSSGLRSACEYSEEGPGWLPWSPALSPKIRVEYCAAGCRETPVVTTNHGATEVQWHGNGSIPSR